MKATRDLLKQLVTDETMEMTFTQIAEQYQITLNPSLLATAYVKVYYLILKISKQYPGLSQPDIASYSLEKLDMCLQTYKPGVKFTTYYTAVLKNMFIKETTALTMQKRKILKYSDSYEQLQENGWDAVSQDSYFEDAITIIKNLNLAPKQERYFDLLLQGFPNSTIAKMLGVTPQTLHNYRKILRKKILLAPL